LESSKLKNIVLLLLLAVNLCLLVMVGVQERGEARSQEQTRTDMLAVLENNGIHMDRADLPQELELTPMTVERDQDSEAALAQALLGTCRVSDLGSGRYAYESALGTAEFRSNGNFSFSFVEGAQPAEQGGEETHALAAMEQIGFTGVVLSSQTSGDQVTVTVRQTWQDLPVLSCQAALEYQGGCLRSITGQRLMGTPQPSAERAELISAPTALLCFLREITVLGDLCSEITAMTPGYRLTTTTESTRLVPVWYVTTDTGAYSLNALTGALERA
jgi:hypothetical protein